MKINLIGAPLNYGCGKTNLNLGPDKIRQAGLYDLLRAHEVYDLGNLYVPPIAPGNMPLEKNPLHFLEEIVAFNRNLAYVVEGAVKRGAFPVTIGGDHSVALGSIGGLLNAGANPAVIWIDAHTDINTAQTTGSGHIHGMPLAASMGIGREPFAPIYKNTRRIDPKNVFLIGPHSIDLGEEMLLEKEHLYMVSAEEVHRRTILDVIDEICYHIKDSGVTGVHLSYDVDSIDPTYAPGVSTPVAGGLTPKQLEDLFSYCFTHLPISSIDIVEYHPDEDRNEQTLPHAMLPLRGLAGYQKP